MNILYKSTRNNDEKITASQAIIKGIAKDGGLYVPTDFPKIDKSIDELCNMNYQELALYIMKKFFDDYTEEELEECVYSAYDQKFEDENIVPIKKENGAYFMELCHGPTLAFKDVALSILPHLLKVACKKNNLNKEVVILTATSGDTGKAALEGFANVKGTKIVVFYPEGGVSEIQKAQMVTQQGENTFVVGIKGNFDDAQTGVKEILNDSEFNKKLNDNGFVFSSANSINVGRLIPQVVYYVYSYLKLIKNNEIKKGEYINVVVPTGNFGNILAANYAEKMGIPINKFICASNPNNVLADFMSTGIYNTKRKFLKTISPSMDILVSSNLERLLYEISGRSEDIVKELMNKLKNNGEYEINSDMKKYMEKFYGNYASDEETVESIKKVYKESKYLIDTHTAVGICVYEKYKRETGDNTKTIIASTASPFKFVRSVANGIGLEEENSNDFKLVKEVSKVTGIKIPIGIKELDSRKVLHKNKCNTSGMKNIIEKFLKIGE